MSYKKMYFMLFSRVTDALEAIAAGNTEEAEQILILAQQDCEEMYIEG